MLVLSEVQVNKILKQFKNASKMAKQLSNKGGMKGLQICCLKWDQMEYQKFQDRIKNSAEL